MNMENYPALARATSPTAKAKGLAFVMFERPDLDLAERFLTDFGLTTLERTADRLVMRAAHDVGPAYIATKAQTARFVGYALRVDSDVELAALTKIDGASPVQPLELPGGGKHVQLADPAGFAVWAVAGQQSISAQPTREPLRPNTPEKRSRINGGVRSPLAAATILRPGHCVIGATEFSATSQWYIHHFGMIPSDIQTLSDGTAVLAFLRCDLGEGLADHHTIVVSQNITNSYSHSAFEVIDLDDVATGQEYLLSKKWTHAWGIGRHILGSQIFDYWRDPWGDKIEHYTDGDVFNSSAPTGVSALTSASLYQWGPQVPSDFEKPKLTPAFLIKAIGNVRRSPELSFKKVRMLLSAIEAPARPWKK
jgi:Glyoxalase/Bleomycin resistance protein/Dioxygenase superfamily